MVHCDTPLCPVVHCGTLWYLKVFYDTPWYTLVPIYIYIIRAHDDVLVITHHRGQSVLGCSDKKCQNRFISAEGGNGPNFWKTIWLKFFLLVHNFFAHKARKFQQFLENQHITVLPQLAYICHT